MLLRAVVMGKYTPEDHFVETYLTPVYCSVFANAFGLAVDNVVSRMC